ncbi:unnamed protein product [Fraxinus pennsylvanica]|uniref:Uncharacterized protein n=1 Tax=Fraxinus pennsylvanica TaxID=56036 RepID=A0AAD2DK49_9LAMI|nr:unnamed protein product [Fraxinus pennsylvanica]
MSSSPRSGKLARQAQLHSKELTRQSPIHDTNAQRQLQEPALESPTENGNKGIRIIDDSTDIEEMEEAEPSNMQADEQPEPSDLGRELRNELEMSEDHILEISSSRVLYMGTTQNEGHLALALSFYRPFYEFFQEDGHRLDHKVSHA